MRLIAVLLFVAALLPAQQYNAFWADAFHSGYKSPSEVEQLLENAAAAKANAIFVQVRRRGDTYYLRGVEPQVKEQDYNPNFDALDYLIDRAHAKGIEVHAWFVVSRLWASTTPPPDPKHLWYTHGPNAKGDDMWITLTALGQYNTGSLSLDPGNPAASQYLSDLIVAVARDYPAVDGLHLDYIRYPEDADYGWNPKAVERFNRLEKSEGLPLRTDARWAEFRRRQVTELVRQIYLRANEIKPSIKLSAALITWGGGPSGNDLDAAYRRLDAYSRVFQDWRGWMEEGILDLGIPMNYFNDTRNGAFLDRWSAYEKDRQYKRALVVGLANYLNPINATLDQLKRVFTPTANGNSPAGICFYSYASTNEDQKSQNSEFYSAVGNYFSNAPRVPDLLWKSSPSAGHLYGWLKVDDGPDWLKDNVTVIVESDTGADFKRRLATDGSGFFGSVDLPPDRYFVRLEREGRELFRTVAKDVAAGSTIPFEIFLKAADFQ
ncbi:MAG: family 10 glycosylhydrolase [Candidatus Solibacter usitatus]|nr:family 10 glycosylhydrolase [Candidatus Solibacter usitatus]